MMKEDALIEIWKTITCAFDDINEALKIIEPLVSENNFKGQCIHQGTFRLQECSFWLCQAMREIDKSNRGEGE